MTIFIDIAGTLFGNPVVNEAETMQALRDLRDWGYQVRLVSGDPEKRWPLSSPDGTIAGLRPESKMEAMRGLDAGDIVCDDDLGVLKLAVAKGAIAVPAAQLRDFSDLICTP